MSRDDAILWVHETVGDRLDGEATLQQCITWIRRLGTRAERKKLEDQVIPALEEAKDD